MPCCAFVVVRHRNTARWEAHLWDGEATRAKTAGSSRTRGKQVGIVAAIYYIRCCRPTVARAVYYTK